MTEIVKFINAVKLSCREREELIQTSVLTVQAATLEKLAHRHAG